VTTDRATGSTWWRGAVVYQVYLRSFADGNGDGLGDLAGLRARLPYLVALGVDAIWINPWYPSPMVDAGYDVSDYRSVDPRFGTLAEAEALLAEAHAAGLRVLLDIVPNHTSDQHPWFQAALAAGPGSPERERYLFRPGRGRGGSEPPDRANVAGGPSWTRVTEPDGRPGEWYLHLFTPQQPDVDWTHPEVRADFAKTLGFWFDRGVDGFRIDVAHSLAKQAGLPDLGHAAAPGHPAWDRDEVHDIYREWRAIADAYPEPRVFVAEARSSACPRSRTSPSRSSTTRCGSARATPTPAATAAGCRSPGRGAGRRTGSARPARPRRPGCRSRAHGRAWPWPPRTATRRRCWSSLASGPLTPDGAVPEDTAVWLGGQVGG
jgi:Alpha amylase, catalytic domain